MEQVMADRSGGVMLARATTGVQGGVFPAVRANGLPSGDRSLRITLPTRILGLPEVLGPRFSCAAADGGGLNSESWPAVVPWGMKPRNSICDDGIADAVNDVFSWVGLVTRIALPTPVSTP